MNKRMLPPLILLSCLAVSGCGSQPTEIPTSTPVPPTETPALDADTLSQMLFDAVKAPDKTEVARLIAAGAPVDPTNDLGVTPLMVATLKEEVEIIRLLLDAGADPEIKSLGGLSALIMAGQQGKAKSIRALVEGGAEIDAVDEVPDHNNTAFGWAVYLGQVEAVKELIALGTDINFIPGGAGDTPVISAVRAFRVEVLKVLIAAKADVNIPNKSGKTALYFAKLAGDEEMISLLEAAGAK